MVRGPVPRRVKAWATTAGVPVINCKAGECKHLIAEEHLAAHPPSRPGVFLVPAPAASLVTATRSTGPEYNGRHRRSRQPRSQRSTNPAAASPVPLQNSMHAL
jgi:hypothetical protein